jgi:hypothetical protein
VISGNAQNGTDYTVSGILGQVDIPPGASSATVTLHALNDAVAEKNEKATMKLVAGPNYKLSTQKKATVTITNVP